MSLLHPSSAAHPHPHAHSANPHPHSLAHRLRAALPFQKSATFRVRLVIHDITNVPLVSGGFSVRWKFRGGKGGGEDGVEGKGSERDKRKEASADTASTAASSSNSPLITAGLDPQGAVVRQESPRSLTSVEAREIADAARVANGDETGYNGSSQIHDPQDATPREKKISQSSMDTTASGSTGISSRSAPAPGSTAGSAFSSAASTRSDRTGLAGKKSIVNLPHLTESATSLASTSSAGSSGGASGSEVPSANGSGVETGSNVASGVLRKRSGLFSRKGKGKAREDSAASAVPDRSNERKGETPVRPLKEHSCAWDFPVTQLVKINISQHAHAHSTAPGDAHPGLSRTGSSTSLNAGRHAHQINGRHPTHPPSNGGKKGSAGPGQLGSGSHSESGLKLVIYQHTPGETDRSKTTLHGHGHPHAFVFGVVNLDLAEYASEEAGMGRGGVSRRYLLKQGKTNATIKLTIELEQTGGETSYITPPLQKGQVVAGINVLSGATSSPMDRLAGSMNRLQPPSSNSTSTSSLSTTATGATSGGANGLSSRPASFVGSTTSLVSERGATPQPRKVPANHLVQQKGFGGRNKRSSHKYGKTSHHHHHFAAQSNSLSAERVIEAIFNPYPSDVPGPFTIPKQREPAPIATEEQLLTDEGTDQELTMRQTKPKRPGHFGGHRLKSALEGLRADHRMPSYHGHSFSRESTTIPPADSLPSIRPKTKAEDWPTDTGKRGWGKKREDSTAPGSIQKVPRELDAETGMPH